jgi:hypothetical protein
MAFSRSASWPTTLSEISRSRRWHSPGLGLGNGLPCTPLRPLRTLRFRLTVPAGRLARMGNR